MYSVIDNVLYIVTETATSANTSFVLFFLRNVLMMLETVWG